jgi:hypothetical protein
MPLTESLVQKLHQKHLWTASVEAAYQAWATLHTSQIDSTPNHWPPCRIVLGALPAYDTATT